jgi:alkylated DNA nucleotide flippase Atl1
MKTKQTWRDKMLRPEAPKIVDVPARMQGQWGPGRMVIATPRLIDAIVRRIPKGKVATVAQVMDRLARDHKCNSACPMTTGIFLRIVAENAELDAAEGKKSITPYWRVLKGDGRLNEKYPGGANRHAGFLKSEGFKLEPATGKKPPKVAGFEERLARL